MDVTRAATARELAVELQRMAALAAELADEAVWRLTRAETAKDVAKALGVSEAAVRKAIQQYGRRVQGLPAMAPSERARRREPRGQREPQS